jgi:hypothetical protein
MTHTRNHRNKGYHSTTAKRNSKSNFAKFQKEITVTFLETIIMVKLFHWKTFSYSTHKATDELYDSLNENMDKFIEVLLGKSGERTNLMNKKTIALIDINSPDKFKERMFAFKRYLVALNHNKAIKQMTNSDLLNIRDEILGDVNKLLYLLTFK